MCNLISQSSSCMGFGYCCKPLPWLNLLLSPLLQQDKRDQSIPVFRYSAKKDIYDSQEGNQICQNLKVILMDIYPDSFLFRLNPYQILYRNDLPRVLCLETLENLCHQIPLIDSKDLFAKENCLFQLAHEAWLQVQSPIPHKKLAVVGDAFELQQEDQKYLTWLI